MQKRYTDAFFAYRASGADPDSFDYDYSADLRTIRAGIAAEPRPLRKQFLKLEYFHIARAESDSTLAQTVLNEVPADSPLWSLEWGGPNNTFSSLARLAHRPADARAYVDRAIESHPDSTVRAAFLFQGLQYARSDRDTNKLRHYYERLEGEYRETQYAARAEKAFDPDRVIQVGKPVPDVAFQGLEDKTKTYRPADFHGRYLLIDFWAVWCGPCVAEMPALHAVWEKYKNRKFAILSVSLDVKRENVAKFRSGKWKMPWLHAYLAGRSQDPVAAAFEVESIPSPVLVDPSGTIVAAGDELRGAGLDATLTRLLGGSPAPPRKD
jgi:thiol-disulfide isomerase/thioredoxin